MPRLIPHFGRTGRIYTAESTRTSMERTKMPNLRNGSKGRFEPGRTWLRVRHSTTELPLPTPVMPSLTCCCHVFLVRPRRLVPGIASTITLWVTLVASRLWTCPNQRRRPDCSKAEYYPLMWGWLPQYVFVSGKLHLDAVVVYNIVDTPNIVSSYHIQQVATDRGFFHRTLTHCTG